MDSVRLLRETIMKNVKPCYLNSANTELSIRCPYCGDSRKSQRSAHLYIQLKEPFFFFCQRCNEKGIVNVDFLKDIKLFDNRLNLMVYKLGKTYKYTPKKTVAGGKIFEKKDIFIPELTGSPSEIEKLDYLNNRLGLNISGYDAVNKFKLVLNFKEFFIQNKLTATEADLNNDWVRQRFNNLNKYGLGFLSYDNSTLIFRSIVDKEISGFRYSNHNVLGEYDNNKKFYSIKTKIDLLKPKLKVTLTEGIIDILGVYHHVYNSQPDDNHLFIAVNGKGYNLIFQHLARMGFLDMDIEIFSDSEINVNFYKHIKNNNPILRHERMKIVYNSIREDFGVKKDEIDIKYTFI